MSQVDYDRGSFGQILWFNMEDDTRFWKVHDWVCERVFSPEDLK